MCRCRCRTARRCRSTRSRRLASRRTVQHLRRSIWLGTQISSTMLANAMGTYVRLSWFSAHGSHSALRTTAQQVRPVRASDRVVPSSDGNQVGRYKSMARGTGPCKTGPRANKRFEGPLVGIAELASKLGVAVPQQSKSASRSQGCERTCSEGCRGRVHRRHHPVWGLLSRFAIGFRPNHFGRNVGAAKPAALTRARGAPTTSPGFRRNNQCQHFRYEDRCH
jgi:hypothetical protein